MTIHEEQQAFIDTLHRNGWSKIAERYERMSAEQFSALQTKWIEDQHERRELEYDASRGQAY